MGDLFYNQLGGVQGSSITLTHNANYNLFPPMQTLISTKVHLIHSKLHKGANTKG